MITTKDENAFGNIQHSAGLLTGPHRCAPQSQEEPFCPPDPA